MNQKLLAIAETAAKDLDAFIRESEEKILEAWSAAEAEALENDAKPKFRLGFTITLDLDKDSMETVLAFGVRHKLSRDQSTPDPSQPELSGVDTVTISSGGKEVTVTGEQFSKAARKMSA